MSLERDPFDDSIDIWNECSERSNGEEQSAHHMVDLMTSKKDAENTSFLEKRKKDFNTNDPGAVMQRAMESSLLHSIFGNDVNRRKMLKAIGSAGVYASIASVFKFETLHALAEDAMKNIEKKNLKIGFVPITCATPIIAGHSLGFYDKYGLKVDIIKTAGWAVARDKCMNGEYDASHLLAPMPAAMSMGVGSTSQKWRMVTNVNTNGQAIVLANKHKDKNNPKDWKGFKFGVPFEYSMHNLLLRLYVAEHGIDPDKDIQIRVIPPPEMVANLRAGNLDGYLSPDPFNQRAVWEKIGFIHTLTKDIWEGHPCCAFACSAKFAETMPNTYGALLKAIIDATQYASKPENRKEIAEAISPTNYLNQPVPVVEQVLTGRYADGLGSVQNVPDRIDFDPFPWHSMGVWILTQMKRWGYIDKDIDYHKVAEQVYLASDASKVMTDLGYPSQDKTYKLHTIMGKTFNPAEPEAYVNSFAIKRS